MNNAHLILETITGFLDTCPDLESETIGFSAVRNEPSSGSLLMDVRIGDETYTVHVEKR